MLRYLALIAIAACYSARSFAQEKPKDEVITLVQHWVDLTHYDCPPVDPASPGGTPENPIQQDFFFEAWSNAYAPDEPDNQPPSSHDRHDTYECRWIRLSGFMMWDDILRLYPGRLYENALESYHRDGGTFYFIENFATGSPPRGDLARRNLTLVGRFYDLCAAGLREMETEKAALAPDASRGDTWNISYPCHEIPAMMLADVRIEKTGDAPRYLLGEANRQVIGTLLVAPDGVRRRAIEQATRRWAASVQKGLKSYAADTIAQWPSMDNDLQKDLHAAVETPDSYEAHLLRQQKFLLLKPQSASVQVFDETGADYNLKAAIGCVCLVGSCNDRWPLTPEDAVNFLGDAACIPLQSRDDPAWRWYDPAWRGW